MPGSSNPRDVRELAAQPRRGARRGAQDVKTGCPLRAGSNPHAASEHPRVAPEFPGPRSRP